MDLDRKDNDAWITGFRWCLDGYESGSLPYDPASEPVQYDEAHDGFRAAERVLGSN